jgi:multiple sugar transport system permease protein
MGMMKQTYGEPKDNYTRNLKIKSAILFVFFVILTIICLLPIYILVVNATRESTAIANGVSFIPVEIWQRMLRSFLRTLTTILYLM